MTVGNRRVAAAAISPLRSQQPCGTGRTSAGQEFTSRYTHGVLRRGVMNFFSDFERPVSVSACSCECAETMTSIYRMWGGLLVAHFIVASSQLCYDAAHLRGARGSIIVTRTTFATLCARMSKDDSHRCHFYIRGIRARLILPHGNVQVNFSGGSGGPLTITLPQAVSFTVTNDTASHQRELCLPGRRQRSRQLRPQAPPGSMSFTTNGGSAFSINSVGNFNLGVSHDQRPHSL